MTEATRMAMSENERKDDAELVKESIEWVAERAQLVAEFQIDCANALERQATILLNLSLAGAGGALAFAVKLSEPSGTAWQQIGMAAASLWLFVVAALVLTRVLWVQEIYGPANDPSNLAPAYRMRKQDILYFDLQHRQEAIDGNRKRNDSVGMALNICRALAIATPLVFVFGAVVAQVAS